MGRGKKEKFLGQLDDLFVFSATQDNTSLLPWKLLKLLHFKLCTIWENTTKHERTERTEKVFLFCFVFFCFVFTLNNLFTGKNIYSCRTKNVGLMYL